MPYLLDHIDKIARDKQRDVLCLMFEPESSTDIWFDDWDNLPARQQVINWLKSNGIPHYPCIGFADPNAMSQYQGMIYLDVPYDVELPEFKQLQDYFENPDGSMRLKGVTFGYLTLQEAIKNSHHDEPGYWRKIYEDF